MVDEIYISIVIPVLNEEESLERLYSELSHVLEPITNWEIIFVDDGSDDDSLNVMKAIGKNVDKGILPRLIQLTRHNNPSLRYQSALILGELKKMSGLKTLRLLCSDKDPMVRLSAAVALVRKGSECKFCSFTQFPFFTGNKECNKSPCTFFKLL